MAVNLEQALRERDTKLAEYRAAIRTANYWLEMHEGLASEPDSVRAAVGQDFYIAMKDTVRALYAKVKRDV